MKQIKNFLFVGSFLITSSMIIAQNNFIDGFNLIYNITDANQRIFFNPLVNPNTTTGNANLSSEANFRSTTDADAKLLSIYAKRKIIKKDKVAYSIPLLRGFNGHKYTIISFSKGESVSSGIVEENEILLSNLTMGSYSIVIYNDIDTYVQVVEKRK